MIFWIEMVETLPFIISFDRWCWLRWVFIIIQVFILIVLFRYYRLYALYIIWWAIICLLITCNRLDSFFFAFFFGEEWIFKCKTVVDFEFIEHSLPRGIGLVCFHRKCAVGHWKPLILIAQYIWYNSQHCIVFVAIAAATWIFIVVATIHETAYRLEMTMDITENLYFPLFLNHRHQIPHCVHDWMEPRRWVRPAPVHVEPTEVSSHVALYHTVRIQHWNNVKYEILPQILSSWVIW